MVKTINLTGTPGKTYDLDKLADENIRTDGTKPLVVQIWEWNPNHPDKLHRLSNPTIPAPVVGQIWLSKKTGA